MKAYKKTYNVRKQINDLKECANAGALFKFKKFDDLERSKKEAIFATVFCKKVYRELNVKEGLELDFETETGLITVTKTVSVEVTGKNEEKTEKIDLKVKLAVATIRVDLTSDYSIDVLVEPVEYSYSEEDLIAMANKNPLTKKFFKNFLTYSMDETAITSQNLSVYCKIVFQNLPEYLEFKENEEILEDFVRVLYKLRLTDADVNGVLTISNIYPVLCKKYPMFNKLSVLKKVEILDAAYERTYIRIRDKRDIYSFARSIYEVMEAQGLHNKAIIDGSLYTFVASYNNGSHLLYRKEIANGGYIKHSFSKFDLWVMLVPTK